jgi:hypothetical protein
VHVLSDILAVWLVEIDCTQVARNSSLVLRAKPTFRVAAEGLGLSGLAGTLAVRRNGYVGLEGQTWGQLMSALGQKQTFCNATAMSALPRTCAVQRRMSALGHEQTFFTEFRSRAQKNRDRWRFTPTVPIQHAPEVGCYLEPIVSEMRWPQASLS